MPCLLAHYHVLCARAIIEELLINSKGKEIGQTFHEARAEKSKSGTASRSKPFKRDLHDSEVQSHLDF